MEKLMENKFVKIVLVISILFSMLISYMPAISNADSVQADADAEYVVFDASCNNGGSVVSNQTIAFSYNFNLKGVQTGFKNVTLSIKDEDSTTPISTITAGNENKLNNETVITNSGRYSVVSFGNVRTGTDFSGTVDIVFERNADLSNYQKTITFLFETEYRDPITGITAKETIEKDVIVTVTPAPVVDKFMADVEITQNEYSTDLGERIPGNKYLGAHYAYKTFDSEYAIDEVSASYNVKINAENMCYGKYVLTVSKTPEFNDVSYEDTNSEENLIVDLSNVPQEFATNVVRNTDGTTNIELVYKTQKEQYTIEDMDETTFFDFNIKVTYKIKYSHTKVVTVDETVTSYFYNSYKYTETVATVSPPTSGGPYIILDYATWGKNNAREEISVASRGFIDRLELTGIEKINTNNQLNLMLAEETTSTGTETSMSSEVNGYNSATSTTVKEDGTVIIRTYTEEEVPEGEETIQINQTDKLVTDLGSVVTIRGVYSAHSEGIDLVTNSEGTTIEKNSIDYTNTDSTSFLSASVVAKISGGTEIYGKTTYLDEALENIENGEVKVTFESKANITQREYDGYNKEIVLYSYNVEDVEAFYESIGISKGNLYYENNCMPTLTYVTDSNEKKTIILDQSQLKVDSINMRNLPTAFEQIEFYKKGETTPFYVPTDEVMSYEVPAGTDFSEYYVKGNIGSNLGDHSAQWYTTYSISTDALKQLGLSDNEIKNITTATRYQYGSFDGNNCTTSQKGTAEIVDPDKLYPKISYFEVLAKKASEENFNTTNNNNATEPVKIMLSMYKNSNIIYSRAASVYNVNPTFYVKLPNIFDFENFKTSITNNSNITIKNTEKVTIDSNEYLKIECEGIFDSSVDSNVTITIDCYRTLLDNTAQKSQTLEAFMITENENYYSETSNSDNLTYGETTPDYLYKSTKSYVVEQSSVIQAYSKIKVGRLVYTPNSTDEKDNFPEKSMPIITKQGTTVEFMGDLNNVGKSLTDVNLIYKLPVVGSTEILSDSKLIEDGYTISTEFSNKYSSILNDPNNTDGTVKQISLTNLSNIKVYSVSNGRETELSSDKYTLYYSEDINAGFDSTFIQYEEGVSDLTNAAVIQVKLNSVSSNQSIRVKYTMDMPQDGGMAGAIFGARYTQSGDAEATELDSAATYVISGNSESSIEIQKIFEGYAKGAAPDGISLSGIEFKLKDESGNFVQVDGTDVIATTNESGIATFSSITPGKYQLVEISEFEGFENIGNLVYITVETAEKVEIEAVNTRAKGSLNIQKYFEDTNEIKGNAIFQLARNSGDSIVYSLSTRTDSEGKATIVGVPYGEYTLTETTGVKGYGIPEAQTITINQETTDVEVTNPLGKGTIIINKTVPDTESVKELSFNIKGIGLVSYVNKQDETITNDSDITVKLSEDYSSNTDITVEIADDEKSAKITITNLPLGFYTIQETDMPKLGDSEEDKYPGVTRTATLENDGEEAIVNIINKKKTGILSIQKTAYIQSGENKEYIGDLSNFQVRITGTSDYGTQVDKTISLDEDGYATTSLEIGKYNVTEVPVDGYDAYYKNSEGNLIHSTTGTEVEITYNSLLNKANTTVQEIENVLTGVGYVRIEKTLEGVTNPQTVIDAGIKFRIIGKNAAGGSVEEIISIDKIDETKNVAYGVSNGILVGGEYQLEEMEATIPTYYEGIMAQPITFTTLNTESAPLVINVENPRAKGELQIITKTEPEGGPLTGISYKVTEVTINNDGTYTKLDGTNGTENTVQEVEGSNGITNPSYAEIKEINAGNYLVELVNIPAGYKKDMAQVVEVPAYGVGHAVFTIEKDEFNKYTKLIISKEVVNSNNEVATQEDFENAQLNINETFEVKITNVNTQEKYYTFISGAQKGIIADLPAGIYEIEEQYKPKYELKGYYNIVDDIITTELTKTAEGKYTFEIKEGTSELVNTTEIAIRNQIDTNFPFGGQDSIENLSKVDTQEVQVVTQAVIYVVDEEGNEIPGAKFKILDSQGNVVNLGTVDNVFTTNSEKIVVKGLEPGAYTFANLSVPEGYVQPENKEFIVYSDIVRVARIEIQADIPRGMLTLSTTYVNDDGETSYVPRSSYKVVDTATGELVTFTKTATGDYKKSNLDDATAVLSLKAGSVELQGLEPGTYEVGLVGVTDGYGMQTDLPETVELVGNDVKNINVEVVKPKIQQISAGYSNTMYLDASGQLWTLGSNSYGEYANGTSSYTYNDIPTKIEFPEENVIITDFKHAEFSVAAIDNKGRVWSWGSGSGYIGTGSSSQSAYTPVCLSEIEGTELNEAYKNGITIKEVQTYYNGKILLDSDGKVWAWGYSSYGQTGNGQTSDVYVPTCITNIEGNPLNEAYNSGIKIEKLANIHGASYNAGAIDSLGRVWMWGSNNYGQIGNGETTNVLIPTCISEIESEFSAAEIVDLSIGYDHTLALDKDGNVWAWGSNSYGQLGSNDSTMKTLPIKLSSDLFNGARIRRVYAFYYSSDFSMFIDEYGKVWFCGYNNQGQAGNGTTYSTIYTPICVSDISDLAQVNVIDLAGCIYNGGFVLALDSNGSIWGWGGNSNYGEIGATANYNAISVPRKISLDYTEHLEYNMKFVKVVGEGSSAIALDELGNVWGIGDCNYIGMGYNNNNTITDFAIIKDLEGKNIVDIDGSSSDIYIALSKDGNVYIMGYAYYGFTTDSSNSYMYAPIDITEKFNLDANENIVDVAIGYQAGAALDSSGKVWTWGYGSYYQLGNGSTSNVYEPVCISDDIGEDLYNVNIKSIYGAYQGFFAIDDQGRIWYWGQDDNCGVSGTTLNLNKNYDSGYGSLKYPTCLTEMSSLGLAYDSGVKFKEISANNETSYVAALDTKGKVWILYGYDGNGNYIYGGNNDAVCINDIYGHVIYNESLKYENYKIEKIYQCYNILYITDNQGTTWAIDSNGTRKITDMYNVPTDIKYLSHYNAQYAYLIDGYGQLWQFLSGEPRCLSGVILNPLYNVKAKNIIADGIVEADTSKGEIYLVDSSNVNFMMYSERYVEAYKGKTIVQIEKNITNTFANNYVIALDEDGKLWTWGGTNYPILGNGTSMGSNTPICISDIDGSELCEAYKNDANFKIKEFILVKGSSTSNDSYVIAIDSNNMLWTWGENAGGQLGNGTKTTTYSPKCISKIENTDLSKAYEDDTNFNFTRIEAYAGSSNSNGILAIDNSGELWKIGYGSTSAVCLTKQEGTDLYKEKENCNVSDLSNFIMDNSGDAVFNGKLWNINYSGEIKCYNFVEGSELYNETQNGITIEKIYTSYGASFAIDNLGRIWSWCEYSSYNSYGQVGNGTTDAVEEPTCISNIEGTALYNAQNGTDLKIVNIEFLDEPDVIAATDSNGGVWVWGQNTYGELGNGTKTNVLSPICISANLGTATVEKIGLYDTRYFLQRSGSYTSYGYCNGKVLIILDSNGNMWSAGGNDATNRISNSYAKTPSIAGYGSAGAKTTLQKISGVSGIKDFVVYKASNSSNIVAYGENVVYTWGYNGNGNLGIGSATETTTYYPYTVSSTGSPSYYSIRYWDLYLPQKISTQINITEIIYQDNNYTIVLDTQGKIWAWGRSIPNYTTTYSKPTCISDISTSIIYEKTIVDAYQESSYAYLTDSEGNMYRISGTSITSYEGNTGTTSTTPTYTGTLADKTIVSYSSNMAIDSEGNLYGWNSYDGSYDLSGTSEKPVCITQLEVTRESNFKNNKTLVNVPIENELYNVKFEDIINDQFVKDTNGDYWFFPESGEAINLSNKVSGKDNSLYGKTITGSVALNYVVTSDNEIYRVNIPAGNNSSEYVMKLLPSDEIKDIKYVFNKAGYEYYVALDKSGKIWTCGSGSFGQLGNSSIENITEPVCISDIEGTDLNDEYVNDSNFAIEKIELINNSSTQYRGVIALDSNGKIWTWGYNVAGELGNNTSKSVTTPICISNIAETDLAAKYDDTTFRIVDFKIYYDYNNNIIIYANDTNGNVWSWGYNGHGNVGNGSTTSALSPVCISGIDGVSNIEESLFAYSNYSGTSVYVINDNGKLWSWGYNGYGQLGTGSSSTIYTPLCISDIEGSELKAAYTADSNFALTKDLQFNNNTVGVLDNTGKVWMWGYNGNGQVGNGSTSNSYTPQCISNIADTEIYNAYQNDSNFAITKLVCRYSNTYALDNTGKVWSWGNNSYGQLGNGTTTASLTPICISNLQDANTELYNEYQNNTDFRIVDLIVGDNYSSISVFAIDNLGRVWSWGYNSYGVLGNGTTTNTVSPVCISNLQDINIELYNAYQNIADFEVVNIYLQGNSSFAIDSLGRIWSWGYNDSYGRLGNGTTSGTMTPQCITSIENTELNSAYLNNVKAVEIIINNSGFIAVCDNGDKYYWGNQYVNGVSTNILTPTKYGVDISEVTSIQNYGKQIAEILDQTHIKDTEGKIYAVSNDGTLTELSTYTPEETPTYTPITIEGVNVIDYATYKALDDQGTLYVWNKYVAGVRDASLTAADATNITQKEYIVEPLYLETNGWSIIKTLR